MIVFFKISEHTTRSMAAYSGWFNSMGDMGNGGPQVNSVLWLPDGYSSYGDERWRVRKLLMSTFQIWPQKNFFACGSPESRKGSDVTGAMWEVRIHHKRLFWDIESSVARTETSDGALESQWWVELKSDLKKIFCHPDLAITGVEVTSQPGLSYTTIPHLAVS